MRLSYRSVKEIMKRAAPRRGMNVASDAGFTLIEILVVVLIIGILAAIAIPQFLAQKGKSQDATAKELVRTAQTTSETYATDHGGTYEGLSVEALKSYESSLPTVAAGNPSYISVAEPIEGNLGYTVTAKVLNGHTFTITHKASGVVERTCTPEKKTGAEAGGCVNGTW